MEKFSLRLFAPTKPQYSTGLPIQMTTPSHSIIAPTHPQAITNWLCIRPYFFRRLPMKQTDILQHFMTPFLSALRFLFVRKEKTLTATPKFPTIVNKEINDRKNPAKKKKNYVTYLIIFDWLIFFFFCPCAIALALFSRATHFDVWIHTVGFVE